jgi:site-specific DNA recombinase
VKYHDQRHRGLHPAAFTYDEWQRIQAANQSLYRTASRTEQVKRVYEFAGYISCIHCGLPLRCDTGNTPDNRRNYYRDAAKTRRISCPTGGNLMVRTDEVHLQFGELLKSLTLPENWRDLIRRDMLAKATQAGTTPDDVEREKERLKLKKRRTVKIYQEGYIDEVEFQAEIAAVELALHKLEVPEVDGVTYGDVVEAGEHLPGMAALWDVATPQERRDMVTLILQPEGLYYDTELKMIAAMRPQPAFLPVLRMLAGVVEYEETSGLLVTEHWSLRNRRATTTLSPILYLFQIPTSTLSRKLQIVISEIEIPSVIETQRRPGPKDIPYGIPVEEWPTVLARVENLESYRKIARDYGVSRETIRRLVQALTKAG